MIYSPRKYIGLKVRVYLDTSSLTYFLKQLLRIYNNMNGGNFLFFLFSWTFVPFIISFSFANTYDHMLLLKNDMGWACGAYGWVAGGVEGLGGETGGKEITGET